MSPRPISILLLQTGETLPSVQARRGGFVPMFRGELARGRPAGGVIVTGVDVMARGQADPLLDLTGVDGVLMTGSPAMVGEDTSWMRWGRKVIDHALDEQVPFLGVCFGHQLLGVTRGADVGPNPRGREIGTVQVECFGTEGDALLDGFPARFAAQVSHVDVIRDAGPRLQVLGRSSHDVAHIVRAGPWAWGVQFHPEFDEDVVLEYIRARRHLIDADHGPGAADLRLERVAPSDTATTVLQRFTSACALRSTARAAPRLREDEPYAG